MDDRMQGPDSLLGTGGTIILEFRSKNGPKMDQKWTKNGSKVDQKWIKIDQKWIKNGSEMIRFWIKNGSKVSQKLRPFGAKGERPLAKVVGVHFHGCQKM